MRSDAAAALIEMIKETFSLMSFVVRSIIKDKVIFFLSFPQKFLPPCASVVHLNNEVLLDRE